MTYQDWEDPELAQKWSENPTAQNPLRAEILDLLLTILEAEFQPGKTILDLGYGSGIVEALIFQRIATAQVVGIDRSDAMMKLAKERLQEFPFQLIGLKHNLRHLHTLLGPQSPLPKQEYQVAISVQALHHLTPDEHQMVYLTLHDILEPNGLFLLADRVKVEQSSLFGTYQTLWNRLTQQYETHFDEGTTFEEHQKMLRERGDYPLTVAQHLEFLKAANFDAECVFKHTNRALIVARRREVGK